jgi:hypothetical protein
MEKPRRRLDKAGRHRALEQAQKMGFIRTNLTEAVTLPRIEKKQIKPLEDEELTAFLTSGMKKESASRMNRYIHSVMGA